MRKEKKLPKVQYRELYIWFCNKGHENEEAQGFEGMPVECETCGKEYQFE